jgi:hypothetical protein
MLTTIIVILIILWLLGYSPLSGASIPNPVLFAINNHPITLLNILILLVISWAIGVLPSPFQAVASVLLILWILSELGIFAIAGMPSIIVLIIIVALIMSIFL